MSINFFDDIANFDDGYDGPVGEYPDTMTGAVRQVDQLSGTVAQLRCQCHALEAERDDALAAECGRLRKKHHFALAVAAPLPVRSARRRAALMSTPRRPPPAPPSLRHSRRSTGCARSVTAPAPPCTTSHLSCPASKPNWPNTTGRDGEHDCHY